MIARVLASLAFLAALLWHGAVYAQSSSQGPAYRYCRVDTANLAVVRTTSDTGRFVYQSTWGGGITPGNPRWFQGYVGWHGSRGAPPELQIIQLHEYVYDATVIPDGSRAVLAARDVAGIAVNADDKQGMVIYRFDVAMVLARFGDRPKAQLRVYLKGRTIPRTTLTIDLNAVRSAVAVGTAVDVKMAGAACDLKEPDVPTPIDPAEFTDCSITREQGAATFSPWNARYSLAIDLAPGIGLAVGDFSYANAVRDFSRNWFVGKLRSPFEGAQVAMLQVTITDQQLLAQARSMTFEIVGTTGRLPVRWVPVAPDWRGLLALEASGPLKLEIRDAAGKLVRSVDVPSGALSGIAPALERLADRLDEAEQKPMLFCQPEAPIVIT